MEAQRRNPVPLAGGNRASEFVKARRLDGPKISLLSDLSQVQSLPPGLDPLAKPIIWRHWFGASLGLERRK